MIQDFGKAHDEFIKRMRIHSGPHAWISQLDFEVLTDNVQNHHGTKKSTDFYVDKLVNNYVMAEGMLNTARALIKEETVSWRVIRFLVSTRELWQVRVILLRLEHLSDSTDREAEKKREEANNNVGSG